MARCSKAVEVERDVKVRGVPQTAIETIKESMRRDHGKVSTTQALRYAIIQFAHQLQESIAS